MSSDYVHQMLDYHAQFSASLTRLVIVVIQVQFKEENEEEGDLGQQEHVCKWKNEANWSHVIGALQVKF